MVMIIIKTKIKIRRRRTQRHSESASVSAINDNNKINDFPKVLGIAVLVKETTNKQANIANRTETRQKSPLVEAKKRRS